MSTTTEALAVSSAAKKATTKKSPLRRFGPPILAVLVLLVIWQLVCVIFQIPYYIIPTPVEVAGAFVEKLPSLTTNMWPTAFEALLGFLVGNSVAVLLAVLFVHWRAAEEALMPVAVFIQTIPIVAIAPVLVLMLGTGYAPKVVIAALISFFPTLVNMVKGLKAVDREHLELFRLLSASRSETFWKLRVFASVPFLFSSLRITATTSVIGAIVAEWIGAQEGLGYLIIQATYNFDTPFLYATMIMASLVAVVFFTIITVLERLIVTWTPESKM
ncbi:ABC transporter permease [Microbacterium sp. MAHUQ-60]|uniref:ABC transporter permease n=1 Tax=unclassified Microbacterium TaxID=2609290 RepID=UPI0036178FB2